MLVPRALSVSRRRSGRPTALLRGSQALQCCKAPYPPPRVPARGAWSGLQTRVAAPTPFPLQTADATRSDIDLAASPRRPNITATKAKST